MAQLLVRNLDDDLVEALKAQAARNRRSVEEEHRRILKRALRKREPRKSFVQHLLDIPASPAPEFDDVFDVPRARSTRPDPFADEGEAERVPA